MLEKLLNSCEFDWEGFLGGGISGIFKNFRGFERGFNDFSSMMRESKGQQSGDLTEKSLKAAACPSKPT